MHCPLSPLALQEFLADFPAAIRTYRVAIATAEQFMGHDHELTVKFRKALRKAQKAAQKAEDASTASPGVPDDAISHGGLRRGHRAPLRRVLPERKQQPRNLAPLPARQGLPHAGKPLPPDLMPIPLPVLGPGRMPEALAPGPQSREPHPMGHMAAHGPPAEAYPMHHPPALHPAYGAPPPPDLSMSAIPPHRGLPPILTPLDYSRQKVPGPAPTGAGGELWMQVSQ